MNDVGTQSTSYDTYTIHRNRARVLKPWAPGPGSLKPISLQASWFRPGPAPGTPRVNYLNHPTRLGIAGNCLGIAQGLP